MTDSALRTRVTEVDGLRGIASLVVLIHHVMLTVPVLAVAYQARERVPADVGWLVFTPVHLFWEGNAAVSVFFVLSGFVLVLPLVNGKKPNWRKYYPQRLLRLYLPVWGSLVIAAVLVVVVPRSSHPSQSWWVNAQIDPLSAGVITKDAALVFGVSLLNGPLWSLRWEVIFSVLLPLYLFVAIKLRRWALAKLALVLIAVAAGALLKQDWLFFLAIFGLGAVLASHYQNMRAWAVPKWAWWLLTVAALLLLNADWYGVDIPGAGVLISIGALLIVAIFALSPAVGKVGNLRPLQWLGRVSFSLYLVHVPIVVTVTMLLSDRLYLSIPVAFALSMAIAWLFYRFVERPTHRLAKSI